MPFIRITASRLPADGELDGLCAVLAGELGLPPSGVVGHWVGSDFSSQAGAIVELHGRDRGQPTTSRALLAIAHRLAETLDAQPGNVAATWTAAKPGRAVTGAGDDLQPAARAAIKSHSS